MHTRACPSARVDDLIVETHNDELLVYDRRSDVAHCLTSVAALVWRSCDGETDVDALVGLVSDLETDGDPEDLTLRALAELADKNLLDVAYEGRSAVSRRQALQRLAGAGMAALAAPLVVSAAVPSAASAKSPPCIAAFGVCTAGTNNTNGDCCGTTLCTLGSTAGNTTKYCNNNTSCIAPGDTAVGTSQGVSCSQATGPGQGAASCCTNRCGPANKCAV